MIDKEIKKITSDRIRIEIGEQNVRLRSEIERIKGEMISRGVLQSGMTITRIAGTCIEAIKSRAQLIWQIVFRFITTAGISYSAELAEELKSFVAQYLPEKLGDLRGYIKEAAKIAGSPDSSEKFEQNLDNERKEALMKVGTEIDLFVNSLKKKLTLKKMGHAQLSLIYIHLWVRYRQEIIHWPVYPSILMQMPKNK